MVIAGVRLFCAVVAVAAVAGVAAAQPVASTGEPRIDTPAEALIQDAVQYARANGVAIDEAARRLRAQEESVATTDRLQEVFADRLAGVSIEHRPGYRIVVLLTGAERVPDRIVRAGGMDVPIVFRTGAAATRAQVADALAVHQPAIRAILPRTQGMGFDARTGELVVKVRGRQVEVDGMSRMEGWIEALTGVPVRLDATDALDRDLQVEGGARVTGINPADGVRYACTTGFTVTDAVRTGIVTAAHCPDSLTYHQPGGGRIDLAFVGEWGVGHQDVQVHVSDKAQRALFYADGLKRSARPLTGARRRTSTRAGDAVCHRGEATGYSCSQVELIDFSPPGDLCAGPCDPVWMTVTGPTCKGGDSGGPVFNGTTAFGITKGASYSRGRCSFYYYMSTDYLPAGWSLLREPSLP